MYSELIMRFLSHSELELWAAGEVAPVLLASGGETAASVGRRNVGARRKGHFTAQSQEKFPILIPTHTTSNQEENFVFYISTLKITSKRILIDLTCTCTSYLVCVALQGL